jgi:hypothetical protein
VRGGLDGCAAVGDEDALRDEDAVGDEDAVEDEDAGKWEPRAAAITAMTTSRPATRIRRIWIRRAVGRAGWLWVTPPVKAAWCCRHVWGFRYAGDMHQP